jgi:hypothetical protein
MASISGSGYTIEVFPSDILNLNDETKTFMADSPKRSNRSSTSSRSSRKPSRSRIRSPQRHPLRPHHRAPVLALQPARPARNRLPRSRRKPLAPHNHQSRVVPRLPQIKPYRVPFGGSRDACLLGPIRANTRGSNWAASTRNRCSIDSASGTPAVCDERREAPHGVYAVFPGEWVRAGMPRRLRECKSS